MPKGRWSLYERVPVDGGAQRSLGVLMIPRRSIHMAHWWQWRQRRRESQQFAKFMSELTDIMPKPVDPDEPPRGCFNG
jgi:hypothetical protein